MHEYKIKYRNRHLILITGIHRVEAKDENDAKRKFYQSLSPDLYEITSVEKLHGGCLTSSALFVIVFIILILLLIIILDYFNIT